MKVCSVDGCKNKIKARGWCRLHYERWQRTGDPINTLIKYVCSIDGCNEKHVGRGYCDKHGVRFRKYGDALMTKVIFNNREYKSIENAFWDKVDIKSEKECWNWLGPKNELGYGHLTFGGKINLTHRFSYNIHFDDIPQGMFICHHCDNPSCCNPYHLFVGTPADNNEDKKNKGRSKANKGSECLWAKLNESIVFDIKERLNKGEKGIKLSKEYNISPMTISNIRKNKSWKHITGKNNVNT